MTKPIQSELKELAELLKSSRVPVTMLGEANISSRLDEETIVFTKAYPDYAQLSEYDFHKLSIPKILAPLTNEQLDTPDAIDKCLDDARLDNSGAPAPPIDAMLHAIMLRVPDYHFVVQASPVNTMAVLCSRHGAEIAHSRLFPDHARKLGAKAVYIPYASPGIALVRRVQQGLLEFLETERAIPRAIYLQNNGLIAMGNSKREVMEILETAETAHRILLNTYCSGGPQYLTLEEAKRLSPPLIPQPENHAEPESQS